MSDLSLDLRDRAAIEDFIESVVEYLPEKDRKPYEKLVRDLEAKKTIKLERMAQMAMNLAVATWPARRALDRFLTTAGSGFEWDAMLEMVRPSTALLLKKLRSGAGTKTLDETLRCSDAPLAIHDAEELEIELVRPDVRLALWQEHGKDLMAMVNEAQTELEAIKKRLKALREQALTSADAQRIILPKLEAYEDRIFFGGETVPLEVLDKELQFDREDTAIPPTDDAMSGAEPLPVRFVVEETEETGPVENKKDEE